MPVDPIAQDGVGAGECKFVPGDLRGRESAYFERFTCSHGLATCLRDARQVDHVDGRSRPRINTEQSGYFHTAADLLQCLAQRGFLGALVYLLEACGVAPKAEARFDTPAQQPNLPVLQRQRARHHFWVRLVNIGPRHASEARAVLGCELELTQTRSARHTILKVSHFVRFLDLVGSIAIASYLHGNILRISSVALHSAVILCALVA